MITQASTSQLANEIARSICDSFDRFQARFREITGRAPGRFVQRDWHGMQADSRERLDIYTESVVQLLAQVRSILGERIHTRLMWGSIKAVYSGLIHDRDDWEIAETYFNSVTRQVHTTIGVDNDIEFVHTDYASPPTPSPHPVFRVYEAGDLATLIRNILLKHPELNLHESAIEHGSHAAAARLGGLLPQRGKTGSFRAECMTAAFYRGEHAYLIGRLVGVNSALPLVLCFRHDEAGIYLDALLWRHDDISMLFSFTRSYFHVQVDRPHDMVAFIRSILPKKNIAETYISLGYNKHGKTELYRHALRQLARSDDKYHRAEGQRGMVMIVFTMPSYPVVFKVIKDQFDYPKECSRQNVVDRYQMVFNHDRAGRLVDAQQYQYLVLDRRRFTDSLLTELLDVASQTVSVDGDRVVIKHCYAERRVTPLDVYVRENAEPAARRAVIDYGQAIKDLAATNLFPGDLLMKNFGLTRRGRVVFYDYDEVCLLTDCNFRQFPQTGYDEDDLAAEPWYGVSPNDIFPEEFVRFLGMPPRLKEVFIDHHADLLAVDFWRRLQARLQAGELFHVAPYPANRRFLDHPITP